MAVEKRKREGKKTIPASRAKRTRSGGKPRKSDGKQASHKLWPESDARRLAQPAARSSSPTPAQSNSESG